MEGWEGGRVGGWEEGGRRVRGEASSILDAAKVRMRFFLPRWLLRAL